MTSNELVVRPVNFNKPAQYLSPTQRKELLDLLAQMPGRQQAGTITSKKFKATAQALQRAIGDFAEQLRKAPNVKFQDVQNFLARINNDTLPPSPRSTTKYKAFKKQVEQVRDKIKNAVAAYKEYASIGHEGTALGSLLDSKYFPDFHCSHVDEIQVPLGPVGNSAERGKIAGKC